MMQRPFEIPLLAEKIKKAKEAKWYEKEIEKNTLGYWIKTRRQKTGGKTSVLLIGVAMQIINKYTVLDDLNDDDHVLPIMSNQKMNAYLKELADVCGITKNLSFHVARHTFATTITLTNGVPIESVSKMLGHKNIKSTQHYCTSPLMDWRKK